MAREKAAAVRPGGMISSLCRYNRRCGAVRGKPEDEAEAIAFYVYVGASSQVITGRVAFIGGQAVAADCGQQSVRSETPV